MASGAQHWLRQLRSVLLESRMAERRHAAGPGCRQGPTIHCCLRPPPATTFLVPLSALQPPWAALGAAADLLAATA